MSAEKVVVAQPRFMRLPKPREKDPLFGLSRGTLNELILPTADNDFTPPVKSYVLKKKGARKGIRWIDTESLTQFILQHEDKHGHR